MCLWRSASLVYGTICNTKITRLKCNFLAQFYTSTHRLCNRWSSFTTFPLTFIAFFANYTNNNNNSNGVGADAIHVHVPLFQKLKLFWSMKCEYLWYRLTLVKFPIWIFLLSILCAIYSFASFNRKFSDFMHWFLVDQETLLLSISLLVSSARFKVPRHMPICCFNLHKVAYKKYPIKVDSYTKPK